MHVKHQKISNLRNKIEGKCYKLENTILVFTSIFASLFLSDLLLEMARHQLTFQTTKKKIYIYKHIQKHSDDTFRIEVDQIYKTLNKEIWREDIINDSIEFY